MAVASFRTDLDLMIQNNVIERDLKKLDIK